MGAQMKQHEQGSLLSMLKHVGGIGGSARTLRVTLSDISVVARRTLDLGSVER